MIKFACIILDSIFLKQDTVDTRKETRKLQSRKNFPFSPKLRHWTHSFHLHVQNKNKKWIWNDFDWNCARLEWQPILVALLPQFAQWNVNLIPLVFITWFLGLFVLYTNRHHNRTTRKTLLFWQDIKTPSLRAGYY